MSNKSILHIFMLGLLLFLLVAGVSAAEDNGANGDLIPSEIIVNDSNLADNSLDSASSEIIVGDSNIDSGKFETNHSDLNSLELRDKDKLSDTEGEYVDVSDAYTYLNEFRTEENVWQLDEDDTTKTYFNTNGSVWLLPLVRDVELENTAKIRAKEISEYYSHYRPDGTICFTIFPDGLDNYGENIAEGFGSCREVTEGWKETDLPYSEQGHRRNMLDPGYNCVGIAAYKVDGLIYWVQNFGLRNLSKDFDSSKSFYFESNVANPEFRLEVPVYANGTFTVFVDGKAVKSSDVFAGKSSIRIYGLAPGSHTIELSYSGDHNYKSANKTQTITVLEEENLPDALPFSYLNTLVQMADNELKLDKDYYFNESYDSDFEYGVSISEDLTLDGQGHTIDGKKLARIFVVNSYVSFKNIKIINGNSFRGSAIYSHNPLYIINSSFIDNGADDSGGAVYSESNINIANSTFLSNNAGKCGGGAYSESYIVVNNSNFTDNYAFDLGGAIYSQSLITYNNSFFTNNTNLQVFSVNLRDYGDNEFFYNEYYDLFINASLNGGIVNLDKNLNNTQTIIVNGSNVVIDGNGYTVDAQKRSRLFYILGDNVTIKNINVINGASPSKGGVIYASNSNIKLINSSFEYCLAEEGGVIYAKNTNVTVAESNFSNNELNLSLYGELTQGGAICISNGDLNISNSSFINHTAFYGGAIHSDGGIVYLDNSFFKDNNASLYAGGVLHGGGDVYILNSTFTDNYASSYGGSIFTFDDAKVFVKDSSFENSVSDHYGGAICTNVYLEISNSRFDNNYAKHHGGVISLWGELVINNSNFTGNNASYGGVIFVYAEESNVSIMSSKFINNSARDCGNIYATSNVLVKNSTFANNKITDGVGGAICSMQNLTILNSSFINNSAIRIGGISAAGAIYHYGDLVINGSSFLNNSAGNGAAIANYGGNLYVDNSGFLNNSALNGGAVFNYFGTNSSIANSTFEDNHADYGGAIILKDRYSYYDDNDNFSSIVYIKDSNFKGNTALSGGAILDELPTVIIETSNFTDNYADSGGSIENYWGAVHLINSTVNYSDDNDALVGDINISGSKILESGEDVTLDYINHNRTKVIKNTTLGVSVNDITVGDDESINFTLRSSDGIGLNATIDVFVGEESYSVSVSNGEGFLKINNLSVGTYSVTAIYAGNSKYADSSIMAIFTVMDFVTVVKNTVLHISTNDIRLGDNEIINFTLVSSDNIKLSGIIDVKVGTKSYNVTVSDGKGSLTLKGLSKGSYDVTASFAGDSNYNKSSASAKFSVSDVIATYIMYKDMNTSPVDTKTEGRIGDYFVVKLVDSNGKALAGLPIKIGFNGKIYDRFTASNGIAKLQINLKNVDTYTFAICFLGDDDYNGSFAVAKITVDKKNPKPNKANENATGSSMSINKTLHKIKTSIVYEDMNTVSVHSADGRIGKYFVVKLVDNNGNALSGLPIKIGFNGKIYDRNTSSDGSAKLQINLAKAGLYTFAIGFLPDSKYQGSFAVAKITVTKQSPKLTASAKTFKSSAKTKSVSATLKTANGNPIKNKKISFTINGKKYTGTTNAKGVASVKISLSKKGTYSCTAKYVGDNILKATSKKFNVKIV